jgi:hypothetical protein
MSALLALFEHGKLELKDGKYYWLENGHSLCLHPFLQQGNDSELPYIFQGLNKATEQVSLLGLVLGDEDKQESQAHLEPVFEPMRASLQGGAGQIFDHSERIAYYQSCFVGRDREKKAILDFCKADDAQNILCVKSPAGMGKGALIADVIGHLQKEMTQVLYHFCGAGMQNSLHATLYHLILQGNRNQYWNRTEESIQRKLDRPPSKYVDVIHFFQALLDEQLNIHGKNSSGNLAIIIDGLDEAQVAYAQLKISDCFYTYNEKEEPENEWRSKANIRWVFTYRCDDNGNESFYRFPAMKELAEVDMLQPLRGLLPEAVDEAFSQFNVSEEFKAAVIEKAAIVS